MVEIFYLDLCMGYWLALAFDHAPKDVASPQGIGLVQGDNFGGQADLLIPVRMRRLLAQQNVRFT